jgi:hypothetical protein
MIVSQSVSEWKTDLDRMTLSRLSLARVPSLARFIVAEAGSRPVDEGGNRRGEESSDGFNRAFCSEWKRQWKEERDHWTRR